MKELPTGAQKAGAVRAMFDSIAPRYDLVNRIMTFGLDMLWRKRAVRDLALPGGSLVVDVACGTGDFCRELYKVGHRPVGIDMSGGMLAKARTEAPLVQADGLKQPFASGAIDGITCGFALRNVVDIGELFDELARVVRPGGRIALLEVSEPRSKLVRFGHRIYFHKIVPLIGRLLSDREAYSYLPRSTAYLPETDELLAMLRRSGLEDVSASKVGLGAAQILYGTRA